MGSRVRATSIWLPTPTPTESRCTRCTGATVTATAARPHATCSTLTAPWKPHNTHLLWHS